MAVMFIKLPQNEDDALPATMIESHDFRRRTRIKHLVCFVRGAVRRYVRGGGGYRLDNSVPGADVSPQARCGGCA